MFCSKCGTQLPDSASFCSACGNSVRAGAPVQPMQQPTINIVNSNTFSVGGGYVNKSKWTAFFLCLFLGCFGAHRFYVGKIGTGILQILTCGGLGIWWFIDFILIVSGAFTDSKGHKIQP